MSRRLPPAARAGRPARPRARRARPLAGEQDLRTVAGAVPRPARGGCSTRARPTANGMPGAHHVEARVFKDVFPRFRTMQGYHVPRKAGWDCHGLPVELAVEKELGFTGKKDIEAYGIAEFNDRCRESVPAPHRRVRGADRAHGLLGRPGRGVPDDGPRVRRVGLVVAEGRSSTRACWSRTTASRPYCPRCGTGLSDHELASPATRRRRARRSTCASRRPPARSPEGAALLVWTTTPWTLVSNTAVAAHPDVTYVAARPEGSDEVLVVAEPLLDQALGEGAERLGHRYRGAELERTTYQRPFDLVDIPDAHYVVLADYVTAEDGTGLVHQAPAFGADDLTVCRDYGMPIVNPVGPDGTLPAGGAAGRRQVLQGRRRAPSPPTCASAACSSAAARTSTATRTAGAATPRCSTTRCPPGTSAPPQIKDRLLEENEKTNWYPETVKHGRYGEWLRNNVDWALSRSRYWGTPLPLWICGADEDHVTCVGSLEGAGRARRASDMSALDPHRPYVDDVTFPCPQCGAEARRVPDVIDAWYDSGSMPFAQWGAPHRNKEIFESSYPAQYICEAHRPDPRLVLLAHGRRTLVFDRSSYENVVCLGLILAEDGRKMSKHLGNVLRAHPADGPARRRRRALVHGRQRPALGGPPRRPRRDRGDRPQDPPHLLEHRVVLRPVRQRREAQGRAWTPDRLAEAPAPADRPLLDRWALAELHRTVREVDARPGGLRHRPRRPAPLRSSSTTCPTGTCAAPAAASGRAGEPEGASAFATLLRVPGDPHPPDGADRRRSSPTTCGTSSAPPTAPSRCTWPTGRS